MPNQPKNSEEQKREKARARAKEWYEKNRQRAIETRRRYYREVVRVKTGAKTVVRRTPEVIKQQRAEGNARYRERHREEIRLYEEQRRRKMGNKPRQKKRSNQERLRWFQNYYLSNKDQIRKRTKQYYETNKERFEAFSQARRARKNNAEGSYTAEQIRNLFIKQRGLCATCKRRIFDKRGHPGKFHIDHVMPLAKGGSNYIDNIQLLCKSCNASKKDKHPDEWARQNGLLFC